VIVGFQKFDFGYPSSLLIDGQIDDFIHIFEEYVTVAYAPPEVRGSAVFPVPEIDDGADDGLRALRQLPRSPTDVGVHPVFIASGHGRIPGYIAMTRQISVACEQKLFAGRPVPECVVYGRHVIRNNVQIISTGDETTCENRQKYDSYNYFHISFIFIV
jgi:hypothetical protein